jgi:signal transduction histidine kinase
MTVQPLEILLSLLDDVGAGVAIFEHVSAETRRMAANRAWAALGGDALDAVLLAGGFVAEERMLETRLDIDGKATPIEIRAQGLSGGATRGTVAVAVQAQSPALRRVAHDLSNPLTYLIIHLRRLRETVPRLVPEAERPKIEQLLVEALEGGERVVTILRELVTSARA